MWQNNQAVPKHLVNIAQFPTLLVDSAMVQCGHEACVMHMLPRPVCKADMSHAQGDCVCLSNLCDSEDLPPV